MGEQEQDEARSIVMTFSADLLAKLAREPELIEGYVSQFRAQLVRAVRDA